MATAYETDKDGKFIPATQRPDGTWRKARRIKDGYTPQEEVPLYESKGKKFTAARPSGVPVGMPAEYVQAVKAERQKKQRKDANVVAAPPKKNPVPGLLTVTSKFEPVKKPKFNAINQTQNSTNTTNNAVNQVQDQIEQVTEQLNGTSIDDLRQEISKKLKKLRKKLRDIEDIETKLKARELNSLDKEKQDKVKRKSEVLNEIMKLEEQRKDLKK